MRARRSGLFEQRFGFMKLKKPRRSSTGGGLLISESSDDGPRFSCRLFSAAPRIIAQATAGVGGTILIDASFSFCDLRVPGSDRPRLAGLGVDVGDAHVDLVASTETSGALLAHGHGTGQSDGFEDFMPSYSTSIRRLRSW